MGEAYFNIKLRDVRFHGHIGVFPQERLVGNDFKVNLSVKYKASCFKTEDLDTSISYAEIYEIVKARIGQESLLLETVAKEITEEISARWEIVEEISTEIVKLYPPITGIDGECAVEYFYKKNS